MIKIEHLTFSYHGVPQPALNDINLQIGDGELVLVTGASDCGKSTLVRTMNGLIPHFYGGKISGTIRVNGIDPFSTSTNEMCNTVGMIFQNPDNQLIMTTVEEEIVYGLENLGVDKQTIAKRIEEVSGALSITHLLGKNITHLSGGEKQKVSIASILAMQPKIIIFDEPTSELDPISADEIIETLVKMKKEMGITLIIIEHRLEKLLPVADRWVIMHENKIIENGTPEEIIASREEFFGVSIPIAYRIYLAWKHKIEETLPLPVSDTNILKMIEIITSHKQLIDIQNNASGSNPKDNFIHPENVLEISNISSSYASKALAIHNVNMHLAKGELLSVVGRNGSGKTTLLKTILGLKEIEEGSIHVDNVKIDSKRVSKNAQTTALIFQNPSIQFYLDTVYEELTITLKNFGFKLSNYSEKAQFLLNYFNLEKYRNKYPRYLSLGTQQKLALASVIIYEPKVILLDEPTHGMDFLQKQQFFELINELRMKGTSVILVTHDIESVLLYSDRVLLLKEGEIIDEGDPEPLFLRHPEFLPKFFSLTKQQEIRRWL